MVNKSLTFRKPVTDKIILGFGIVMFTLLAYVAWVNQFGYKNRIVIVLLAFAFLCLIGFLGSFYSVTLTEKEIIVRDVLRVRRLMWDDVYDVIPGSYLDSFTLSDRNRDTKVYISSQVKGYLELVWLIKKIRPDIWEVRDTQPFQEFETFHRHPFGAIYSVIGGIGMIVSIFFIPSSGNMLTDNLAKIVGCVVGIFIVSKIVFTPRKLEFQGTYLVLSLYGGWKRSIHADEVKDVYIKRENTRGGIVNLVHLVLENKKKINLSDYKEGAPLLTSALEKWMKTHKTKSREKD